jgi:hypothetical protein
MHAEDDLGLGHAASAPTLALRQLSAATATIVDF